MVNSRLLLNFNFYLQVGSSNVDVWDTNNKVEVMAEDNKEVPTVTV